jgi:hypothetical protein
MTRPRRSITPALFVHSLFLIVLVVGGVLVAPTALRAQGLPVPPNGQTLSPTDEESFPHPGDASATLFFGAAVAIHERHLLVGIPEYGVEGLPLGSPTGRVAVFTLSRGNQWVRSASLDPPVGTAVRNFGERVALGERFALVGSDSGVDVFRRAGETWTRVMRLVSTSSQRYDGGLAVADRSLLVGVSLDDQPGAVDVLAPDSGGHLHRVQRLHATRPSVGDVFGLQLATSQGTLVVGASGYRDGEGAAFVYKQAGTSWVPAAQLSASEHIAGWGFGDAVAVDGDRIAIGSPGAHPRDAEGQCEFQPSGAVYVFARHGSHWVQTVELMSADPCTSGFAVNVAINHDYIAANAPAFFRAQASAIEVFKRVEGTYERKYDVSRGEGATPPIALSDTWFLIGFPFAAQFDPGSAAIFDLASAP